MAFGLKFFHEIVATQLQLVRTRHIDVVLLNLLLDMVEIKLPLQLEYTTLYAALKRSIVNEGLNKARHVKVHKPFQLLGICNKYVLVQRCLFSQSALSLSSATALFMAEKRV